MTSPIMGLETLLTLIANGGLRFDNRPAFQLIIPSNAGPNDTRIEIGSIMPADLVTRYGLVGEAILGGIIFYRGGGISSYGYIIETTGAARSKICIGMRDGAGNISEWVSLASQDVALNFVEYGRFSTTLNTLASSRWYNNNLSFEGIASGATFNGQLEFNDGTGINMFDTSTIDVFDTAEIVLFGTSSGDAAVLRGFAGSSLVLESDIWIDGISGPRGLRTWIASAANSAAIGAETIVLTTAAMDFIDGRAYEIIIQQRTTHSAANVATMRIRRTNLAGASLAAATVQVLGGLTATYTQRFVIRRTAGSDLNDNLVLTLAASAGTCTALAGADTVRYLEVRDCGAAGDYATANTI